LFVLKEPKWVCFVFQPPVPSGQFPAREGLFPIRCAQGQSAWNSRGLRSPFCGLLDARFLPANIIPETGGKAIEIRLNTRFFVLDFYKPDRFF